MFRTLAMRLTAMYVFAAVVLVVIVGAAVTFFALQMVGISTREAVEAAARAVPEVLRDEMSRHGGSLVEAAPDVVREISRPGIRIVMSQVGKDGSRRFLAATSPEGPAAPPVVAGSEGAAGGPPGGVPGMHAPLGMRAPPGYPFNFLLHVEPRFIEVADSRIGIFPDPAPLEKTIGLFWIAMLPMGLFVTLVAWLLGRYIAGQALRPLTETTASLNRFAAGDFTPRPIVSTDRSEIGELVQAYNGAVAQVTVAFEERRKAEVEMRQFIADAGHELRTPLTVIMGFIDVLRRRAGADPAMSSKIYETMLAESRRMRNLVEKLIVLARMEYPQMPEVEPVDLSEVASSVVRALGALQPDPRIALAAEPGAIVNGVESDLREAIWNLVENAVKHAPLSPIEIAVRRDGGDALVEVADRGPGIPAEDRASIFDRFYRGSNRNDSQGFGLGLAIAKRAIERAGGSIEFQSEVGTGTRFTIRIPRAARGKSPPIAV
jgi:two-component system OmpR family sensor kinase